MPISCRRWGESGPDFTHSLYYTNFSVLLYNLVRHCLMTLTQTANLTRRGIIIIIVLMIIAISGSIGYSIWNQYRISQIPPVMEQPEMKFGILPAINFPASNVTSSNYSYSLDTETGNLPQIPK